MLAASGTHQAVDAVHNPRMNVLVAYDELVAYPVLLNAVPIGFGWNDVEGWLETLRFRNQMSRHHQTPMNEYHVDGNVFDA